MKLEFKIPKMTCDGCVKTIAKAVTDVDAKAKVSADLKTKLVSVETEASPTTIKEATIAVGYPPVESGFKEKLMFWQK
ncbi:heavy-metal-associated domain-containing protein [Oscillatoria salina]|uniref:heavy-metal-associated domain-containing protein n=1 Tax=Oscillatoria salina TaxID=331517 RepID=UPI0013BDF865|nr:heavy-metal-associated domain-containing protein [Oscillatoria salina]MBZ8180594.1 heavy-metal-associated domain-containing protein [Oscillatoria salina IIICB1]NET91289.1 heavy-metal-associated domain-containing protein [Kamptonema sp. SIO1D9]